MDKEKERPEAELVNRFVQVYGPDNSRIQKLLFEHGYIWTIKPAKVMDFSTPVCIFLHRSFTLTWDSSSNYAVAKKGYTEVSVKELTDVLNKGKESKMKKELRKEDLRKIFVHTPNDILVEAVHKMLTDGGFKGTLLSTCLGHLKKGVENKCLCIEQTGFLCYCDREWYKEHGYTELSLAELADILAKPAHTLMTPDELKERISNGLDDETAHVLSIEKWERLMKEENWEELSGKANAYIKGDTCALCRLYLHRIGGGSCRPCPLNLDGGDTPCGNPKHPWSKVRHAVNDGNRRVFLIHANDLLGKLQFTLDELHKPKRTYRIGQWFREGKDLYILARTDDSEKLNLVKADDGNIWSYSTTVEDVNKVTEAELRKIGSGRFVPVDVEITEKKGAEK